MHPKAAPLIRHKEHLSGRIDPGRDSLASIAQPSSLRPTVGRRAALSEGRFRHGPAFANAQDAPDDRRGYRRFLYPAASSAQAIDGEDFATKLTAALGPTDMALSYGNAEVSGDVVTLSDVTLDNRDGDDIELGSVIFEGVAGEDDGGYTVREAIFPDIDVSEGRYPLHRPRHDAERHRHSR
jgi:hypothetical protein